MKKNFYLISFILISVFLQNTVLAAPKTKDNSASNFTPSQVEQIQNIVHSYVVNNPQILLEAGKKLQEQESAKQQARIKEIEDLIPKYKTQIFDTKAPGRVVLGNPDGKIIVAEFTQHQCSSCRQATPIIKKLIKDNPEIKLIIIYWPFLGNDAIYSSKAVLAAHKQNKFGELNQAILTPDSFVNKEKTDAIIKSTPSVDSKKLYTDMSEKDLENGIKANFELAQNLKIIGTPTFIFTNKEMTKFSLIPGQTNNFAGDLARALNEVR